MDAGCRVLPAKGSKDGLRARFALFSCRCSDACLGPCRRGHSVVAGALEKRRAGQGRGGELPRRLAGASRWERYLAWRAFRAQRAVRRRHARARRIAPHTRRCAEALSSDRVQARRSRPVRPCRRLAGIRAKGPCALYRTGRVGPRRDLGGVRSRLFARAGLSGLGPALAARSPSQLVRRRRSDSFVARGGERSADTGANAARVGMPVSSTGFGLGAALLRLLEAPFLTAFSPKKRCPFQLVPVIALATCERLR